MTFSDDILRKVFEVKIGLFRNIEGKYLYQEYLEQHGGKLKLFDSNIITNYKN